MSKYVLIFDYQTRQIIAWALALITAGISSIILMHFIPIWFEGVEFWAYNPKTTNTDPTFAGWGVGLGAVALIAGLSLFVGFAFTSLRRVSSE